MTRKPVVARSEANRDIAQAVRHYRTEGGEDVALGFVEALERAFAHIAGHPASGSPRYAHELDLPGLRAWPLKRYPYLVFYAEGADGVEVWRVLQAGRDIPAWIGEPEAG